MTRTTVLNEQITALLVRDFFSEKIMNGYGDAWAASSGVIVSKGPEIVPLATEKDLEILGRRY